MSALPMMPLWIGDYMADTMHLTTEQHGAYFLLIMACWTHGGSLPNDDAQLAAITKLDLTTFDQHRKILAHFFKIDRSSWRHKRVDQELGKAADLHAVRSKAGSKGNAKRWQTHRKPIARARVSEPELQEESPTLPSSDSNESAPSTARRDPIKELWGQGLRLLTKAGVEEPRARKLVGQWRKSYGDAAVMAALARAEAETPSEAVAFLIGVLANGGGDERGFGAPGFA